MSSSSIDDQKKMSSSSIDDQKKKMPIPKTSDGETSSSIDDQKNKKILELKPSDGETSSSIDDQKKKMMPSSSTDDQKKKMPSSSTDDQKNKKMLLLKTSDGETFEVEETVAMKSETIKHMVEDGCAEGIIPLANVSSDVLAKVIEYCKRHTVVDAADAADDDVTKSEAELKKFDDEFVKMEKNAVFDLILAANYLDIKSLLSLMCESVANMIKDLKVEEVREMFNIENDFTEEEEAKVRAENAWAFE